MVERQYVYSVASLNPAIIPLQHGLGTSLNYALSRGFNPQKVTISTNSNHDNVEQLLTILSEKLYILQMLSTMISADIQEIVAEDLRIFEAALAKATQAKTVISTEANHTQTVTNDSLLQDTFIPLQHYISSRVGLALIFSSIPDLRSRTAEPLASYQGCLGFFFGLHTLIKSRTAFALIRKK